jgi:LmbE family N-acetylglucosaminyl deacetylase
VVALLPAWQTAGLDFGFFGKTRAWGREVRRGFGRWSGGVSVAAALSAACAAQSVRAPVVSPSARTLVAVIAHPDDETFVSPILAHYARAGVRVYMVIATDGSQGVAPHAGTPAGDSLAAIRVGEARCVARELGLREPILLGLPDAGLAALRPWPGEPLDRLATRLEVLLRELRPQAVITWGPGGGYGHADHRLVGDVVTQLFQSGAVPQPARLYFAGFTDERMANSPRRLGVRVYPTAPGLLTTQVAFGPSDLAAARRALGCHRSQFTEQAMNETFATLEYWWQGRVSFQEWRGAQRSEGLF